MPLRSLASGLMIGLFAISCSPKGETDASLRLSPEQAVFNAAQSEEGTSGVFEMVVRETGRQNGRLFLNSQKDYRDPRNLTIALTPTVERDLSARLGAPVVSALSSKTIAVRGTAKKTKIWFFANGQRSDKYYFQTQIALQSADDLTVAGETAF